MAFDYLENFTFLLYPSQHLILHGSLHSLQQSKHCCLRLTRFLHYWFLLHLISFYHNTKRYRQKTLLDKTVIPSGRSLITFCLGINFFAFNDHFSKGFLKEAPHYKTYLSFPATLPFVIIWSGMLLDRDVAPVVSF
jgi:hypothetical protein